MIDTEEMNIAENPGIGIDTTDETDGYSEESPGLDSKLDPAEAERLKESFAPGHYLIRLRRGEKLDLGLKNPYLFEAHRMTDILFTRPEIAEKFPGIFPGASRPVILEIGCYMGNTMKELAGRNLEINFLGVDIKYKRVVKTCRRLQRDGLTNARVAISDGRELLGDLPEHSLQGIIAFFPDPWRRKKHEKHRFLNDYFFSTAARKLIKNGFIWIKTDSEEYRDEAREKAQPHGYRALDSLPMPLLGENHRSFFEQLFIGLGRPIHQLILKLESLSPVE